MVTIRRWAVDGARRGSVNPSYEGGHPRVWRLGKPDALLRSGPISVPSEGGIHWIFTKLKMPRGGVVRGFEIWPDNPLTIRQATIGWAKPGLKTVPNTTTFQNGVAPIGSWAYGYYAWRMPPGSGILIPGKSELHVMLQCQAIGKPVKASFALALYFEGSPRTRTGSIVLEKRGFTLQKGEKIRMDFSRKLDRTVKVTSILPEFRYACERVELTALLPNADSRNLMTGRWDVYWTGAYNFIWPPTLPAGTELKLSAFYNNGFDAAHGPDTRVPVHEGVGLSDERCKVIVQFIEVGAGSDSSEAALRTVTLR